MPLTELLSSFQDGSQKQGISNQFFFTQIAFPEFILLGMYIQYYQMQS